MTTRRQLGKRLYEAEGNSSFIIQVYFEAFEQTIMKKKLYLNLIILMILTSCASSTQNDSMSICRNILGKNKINDWAEILPILNSSSLHVTHHYDFSEAYSEVMDIIQCTVSKDTNNLDVTFSYGESLIGKSESDVEKRIQVLHDLGFSAFKKSYVDVEISYEGKVIDIIELKTSYNFIVIMIGR